MRQFQRPLFIAVLPVASVYFFLYRGSAESLESSRMEVSVLREAIQYAPKYREIQDQLNVFYTGLPSPKDKDRARWLTETVQQALRDENLSALAVSSASENKIPGALSVDLHLKLHMKYRALAALIARFERLRYPVHVVKLAVSKDDGDLEFNNVEMTLSVMFPLEGA